MSATALTRAEKWGVQSMTEDEAARIISAPGCHGWHALRVAVDAAAGHRKLADLHVDTRKGGDDA